MAGGLGLEGEEKGVSVWGRGKEEIEWGREEWILVAPVPGSYPHVLSLSRSLNFHWFCSSKKVSGDLGSGGLPQDKGMRIPLP